MYGTYAAMAGMHIYSCINITMYKCTYVTKYAQS